MTESGVTARDHRLIDGKAVQNRLLAEVREQVSRASATRPVGRLVSISIGPSPEIAVYVRNQARGAAAAGIPFDQQLWSESITQDEAKHLILELNDRPDVLGIILQRPVPAHINVRSLQSAIHPLKDVEGMNPASIGNIVYNDVALAPCTAAAAVELVRETGLDLKGLEVVMIGHSEIVGKPAAFLLMAEGATVTVCHHMTRSVAMHSRRADVVVVAVGKAHLIGPDMIKPGAAVIDIGINQVTDPDGTVRIVGDVDTEKVKEVAGWITPVPGGVGPVTVAILMRNAIVAHQRQIAAGWLKD
ncbi:bifunctional 5,10-methylenetetrahydrofolate dehydrogenase/5,10-methenyltetrahydrofolate cyclohydrolase [Pseudogemmobacter humi]|uniref:Bifunctional protein FolD n=1 Tax=Pseudogemmobacter humi TaxID=2483812 RepID=A0A3P5XFN2_9RHOB|nr:bifunctional 5,10-methylenetetrahydrofolate dehydrogenase/5,10-methenyltetrahydrofolate cyclohydrolase [Pseudogemmobacter humi]VDC27414.1 Bifunctional protein FolD protein [Pseudogemmobacter humi]